MKKKSEWTCKLFLEKGTPQTGIFKESCELILVISNLTAATRLVRVRKKVRRETKVQFILTLEPVKKQKLKVEAIQEIEKDKSSIL